MKINLKKIIENLKTEYIIIGNTDVLLEGLANTLQASKNQITFIDKERNDKSYLLEKSNASVIILDFDFKNIKEVRNKVLICVENPKLIFSQIYHDFFKKNNEETIHNSSIINSKAKIHKNVTIESNCIIGNCEIGNGSIIKSGSVILDNVKIGKNVLINSNCVLGSDGYGYVRDQNKFPIQFPHIGGIIIEDNVDIGSNSSIDNGSLTPTIIGFGSKIDNLVHIGHNVKIGKCVFIAAQSSIAGSTIIGDYTEIWTGVNISDGVKIGKNCSIGIGSVVIKDIIDNKKVFGNPAREYSTNN